jgi:hypothetical protein
MLGVIEKTQRDLHLSDSTNIVTVQTHVLFRVSPSLHWELKSVSSSSPDLCHFKNNVCFHTYDPLWHGSVQPYASVTDFHYVSCVIGTDV